MDHQEEELEPAETDFDIAVDLYMQYMIQYRAWRKPQEGTVSPAVNAFFAASPPGESGFVGFARWLMIPHETDDGSYFLIPEQALAYVEALHPSDDDELPRCGRSLPRRRPHARVTWERSDGHDQAH